MFDPLNSESFKLTFTRAELALLAYALDFADEEGWPYRYPGMEWDNELYKKVAQQVRKPWLASMYWLACGFIPGSYVASEERDYSITRDRLIDYKQYGRRVVDEVTSRIHGMNLDDIENVY